VFSLLDEHLSQTKNYLVAYDKPIGLLINFGSNSLQFKKVFNPRYHDKKLYNETKKNKENNQRNERIKSISHILSSCNPEDPGHPDN
jgi:hypothetical protein